MAVIFLCSLLLLGPLTSATPLRAPSEKPNIFSVTFDTPRALGLQLDAQLRVMGFHRDPSGGKMPAEASGWISIGDTLVAVNGERTVGSQLHTVTALVARAALPRVLSFAGPAGGNRVAEMRGVYDGPSGIHGHEGSLELATRAGGVALGALPFLQAMFGGPTSCAAAPLVLADPPQGCAAYNNQGAAFGAIVVVERGQCTFSDKAAIAQGIGAVGVIVLNEAGNGFVRMPIDAREAARLDITVPVVMVDAGRGAETVRLMLPGAGAPRGGGSGGGGPLPSAAAASRTGGGAGGGAGAAATLTPTPTRVLGGVQARLVRTGQTCKPWKAPAAAGAATGGARKPYLKGSSQRGKGVKMLPGGEGEVGDPMAAAGELLLFPQGAALRQGCVLGGGGTPLSAPESLSGPHSGHGDSAAMKGISGSDEDEGVEGDHAHASGFYSDKGRGEDGLLHPGGGADGSPQRPVRAASSQQAAAAAAAAASARAAAWAREEAAAASGEEEEGGGELATLDNVAAAALLAKAREGSSARIEYMRAAFGGPMPQGRLRIVLADPWDACVGGGGGSVRSGGGGQVRGAAVLVGRGGCGFEAKARAVAAAGGVALLVANNEPGLVAMRVETEGGGGWSLRKVVKGVGLQRLRPSSSQQPW